MRSIRFPDRDYCHTLTQPPEPASAYIMALHFPRPFDPRAYLRFPLSSSLSPIVKRIFWLLLAIAHRDCLYERVHTTFTSHLRSVDLLPRIAWSTLKSSCPSRCQNDGPRSGADQSALLHAALSDIRNSATQVARAPPQLRAIRVLGRCLIRPP